MKRVYLIRHAKSSWKDMSLDDFDRPLNKRGKANAPMMGERLSVKGVKPDLIISSPAKRAKMTAEVLAEKVTYEKEILFDDDIYDAFIEDLEDILRAVSDSNRCIFLIGHNPELNDLVQHYVHFDENLPTCGIVEIEFDCEAWRDISMRNAKLISFDYPKKNIETEV